MTQARDAAFVAGCFGLLLSAAFWMRFSAFPWEVL